MYDLHVKIPSCVKEENDVPFPDWLRVQDMPYLFQQRHPVQIPNFDGVAISNKLMNQSIVGAAHEKHLDCEPMSPGHLTF